LREQQLVRSGEHGVEDARECAASGEVRLDGGHVAMGFSFSDVANVALVLECSQNGEDSGAREVVGEGVADFGDGAGAPCPEDSHDVELAVGEGDAHGCSDEVSSRSYHSSLGVSTIFLVMHGGRANLGGGVARFEGAWRAGRMANAPVLKTGV